jgi:hypothetical protein
MPVLSPSQQAAMRAQFKRLIHNEVTSVKKADVVTSVQPDPRIEARNQTTLRQWDDFWCSMFHFLSGKTDRMLSERGERDLIAALGLSPETIIVIQYVSSETLSVPTDGLGGTTVNDLEINDEILYRGHWYNVKVVIPDSERVQHTVLAAK